MENAKKWVNNSNLEEFPKMIIDNEPKDTNFHNIDKGVSIFIQCDQETFPRDLSWLQVKDAKTWLHILCIKTGLGSIKKQDNIKVCIEVIDKNGQNNNYQQQGIGYLWIHELPLQIKNARFYDIKDKKDSLYKKDKKDNIYLRPYHGVTHIMYNRYTNEHEMNLIVIEELIDFLNNPEEEEERQKEKYEG